MNAMNLVEGGARAGLFQTRHPRIVQLRRKRVVPVPVAPGEEPRSKVLWEGTLFMANGTTPDTDGLWEESGAFANQNGVISRSDLVKLVRIDEEQPVDPVAPASEVETLRARVAELEAENAELKTKLPAAAAGDAAGLVAQPAASLGTV